MKYALVLALLLSTNAGAQNARNQTFPLNTPLPDTTFFCFDLAAAKAVALAAEEPYFETVLVEHLRSGACGSLAAIFTYTRRAYRAPNGHNVYEALVGKVKVYVPTKWRAEGET